MPVKDIRYILSAIGLTLLASAGMFCDLTSWGWVDDPIHDFALNGFLGVQIHKIYIGSDGFHCLLEPLIIFLYKTFPLLSWFGIIEVFLYLISCCIVIHLIVSQTNSAYKPYVFLILGAVFSRNFFMFTFINLSVIATAAGLLLLYNSKTSGFKNIVMSLLGIVFLTIGFQTRLQAAFYTGGFMLLYFLSQNFSTKNYFIIRKPVLFFALFTLLFWGLFQSENQSEFKKIKAIDHYLFKLNNAGLNTNFKPKNLNDSLRLKCLLYWYVANQQFCNTSTLKTFGESKISIYEYIAVLKKKSIAFYKDSVAYSGAKPSYHYFPDALFIMFCWGVILYFFWYLKSSSFWGFMIFTFGSISMIWIGALLVYMPARLFYPIADMLLVLSLIFITTGKNISGKTKRIFPFLFLCIVGWYVYNDALIFKDQQRQKEQRISLINRVKNIPPKWPVWIDTEGLACLHYSPLSPKVNIGNHLILFDGYLFMLYPQYLNYCLKKSGSDSYVKMIQKLSQTGELVFFGNEDQLKLRLEVLNQIYKSNLWYRPFDSPMTNSVFFPYNNSPNLFLIHQSL